MVAVGLQNLSLMPELQERSCNPNCKQTRPFCGDSRAAAAFVEARVGRSLLSERRGHGGTGKFFGASLEKCVVEGVNSSKNLKCK